MILFLRGKRKMEKEHKKQPWFDDDDWGSEVLQAKIARKWINNENEALLDWPINNGGYSDCLGISLSPKFFLAGAYLIANKDELNKWGNPRAYALHPQTSTIHQVSPM
jgi:primary-amine oxidase